MANLPDLVQKLIFTAEGLEKTQSQTTSALSAIGQATDQANQKFKPLGSTVKTVFGATSSVLKTVGKDVLSFGKTMAVGGVGSLMAFGTASAHVALRAQEMDVVLKVLGENAHVSKESMDEAVTGIRHYGIELGVAQDLVAQFTRGQMDVTKATDLARTAQDLAVITGQNSSDTLNELLYGLQTGNTQLDVFQKLNFRAGDALKAFADANGKAVKDLTQTERQQALLNGVLEAGTSIQGAYNAAMESPGKQMRSWPRYINDIQVALGATFVDAIGGVVKPISELLKLLGTMVDKGGALAPIVKTLGQIFTELVGPITNVIKGITGFLKGLDAAQVEKINAFLARGLELFREWAPMIIGIGSSIGTAFAGNIPIIGQFIPTISPITGILIGIVGSSDTAKDALKDLGKQLWGMKGNFKPIMDAVGNLIHLLGDTLGGIIKQVTPSLVAFVDVFSGKVAGIVDAFGQALAVIGPAIGDILSAGLDTATGLFGTLADTFVTLAPLVANLAAAFGEMVSGALSQVGPPLDRIIKAFTLLAESYLPALTQGIKGLGAVIGPLVGGALGVLATIFEKVAQFAAPLAPYIAAITTAMIGFTIAKEVASTMASFAKGLAGAGTEADGLAGKLGNITGKATGVQTGIGIVTQLLQGGLNPTMIATTAVTAIATIAIGNYIKQKQEQAARIATVKSALQDETKAMSENVQTAAVKLLQDAHQTDDLQRMGLTYDQYTKAINGNQQAIEQVRGSYAATEGKLRTWNAGQEHSRELTAAETAEWVKNGVVLDEHGQKMAVQATNNKGFMDSIKENQKALSENTKSMVNAAVASGNLSKVRGDEIIKTLGAKDAVVDYGAILDEVQSANRNSAESQAQNAAALKHTQEEFDNAATAASSYASAIDKVIGRNLDAEKSNAQLDLAMQDFSKTVGENGGKWSENGVLTAKARVEYATMAEQILKNAETNIKQGMSLDEVTTKTNGYIATLQGQLMQSGLTEAGAAAYIATLGLTPESITTILGQAGADAVIARVRDLVEHLAGIPEDKMTVIKTALDGGDLATVQSTLQELGYTIPAEVFTETKNADETQAQLDALGNPVTAEVTVETPNADAAAGTIDEVAEAERTAEIGTETPDATKADDTLTKVADETRSADINSETPDAEANQKALDDVAKARTTQFILDFSPSISSAEQSLNNLVRDRTVTITQVTNQAPGMASGGAVYANRLYTVGEKGPELFVPSQSGTIFPANDPYSKAAAKAGALNFVDPMGVTSGPTSQSSTTVVAAAPQGKSLSIGAMNIYQDLDMDVALTRMGMLLAGSSL